MPQHPSTTPASTASEHGRRRRNRPTTLSGAGAAATYADASTFPPVIKTFAELSQKARGQGLLSRTPWFYLVCGFALAVAMGGCITGFILLGNSWLQLLVAAALGIVFTQVAFLSHEAAHRQILAGGRANDNLARILGAGIVGMSYSWWDSKHSRHHANPNKVAKDPDIAVDTISFLAEDAAQARGIRRLITRHQGWAFFPLLTMEGINLHVQSVKHLLSRGKVKGRWLELALLAIRFAAVLVPVFTLLPLGMAAAFMGVQLAVFGVYMGASFAPNHKGMPVIAPTAKLDFFTKQVRTSRNIRGGWWATWLMGGLNYQVEHHLFPSMPRPHLSRVRRLVLDACTQHDVPYTETSLWRSYAIVVGYLNRVGLAARDPFQCPIVAQYRRV